VYAQALTTKWLRMLVSRCMPGLMLCFNCANCPGQIAEVFFNREPCRNYRARQEPSGKRGEPPEPQDGVCFILLTQGQVAMVDAEDFPELNKYKWCAVRRGNTFYASRGGRGKGILMHRVIMHPPDNMVVDHIDGNGLNNCKSNLRICTKAQNNYNSRPKGATCRFKGVSRLKRNGKYRAVIGYKGELTEIGEFDDPLDAARARDMVARELQGEHAWLNLPEEISTASGPGDSAGRARGRPVSEKVLRAVHSAIVRVRQKHPLVVQQAEHPAGGA
jgi:hypothetical protein